MKFHVATWGCQMNDHDSEKLAGLLLAEGLEAVDSVAEADAAAVRSEP